MSLHRISVRSFAALLFVMLSLSLSAMAKSPRPADLTSIRIDNFGRINDNYYRGAQPQSRDYADLAGIGVKTVIDLTKDGDSLEPTLVQRAGMNFYRIPMTTSDRPSASAIAQ